MNRDLVIGIGEALWDMLPDGKKMGGAPANFAYHVNALGLPSCAVSALGNDHLGDELMTCFEQRGLNVEMARVDYPTGTVQVQLDDHGIPTYDIRRGVAWDNIPFTVGLERLAGRARAVCFGSLAQRDPTSRATIQRFLDATPSDGSVLKIFDINLRQDFYNEEIIEGSMRRCNILKINDEELVIIGRMFGLGSLDLEEKCRELMTRYDLETVILTCGANGSYVLTPTAGSFVDTPKVDVVDTVGAGDSFTGAFTAALLAGKTLEEAHRLAVEVSAYVCTQPGPMPDLPASLHL